jgi:hypothetical protein
MIVAEPLLADFLASHRGASLAVYAIVFAIVFGAGLMTRPPPRHPGSLRRSTE